MTYHTQAHMSPQTSNLQAKQNHLGWWWPYGVTYRLVLPDRTASRSTSHHTSIHRGLLTTSYYLDKSFRTTLIYFFWAGLFWLVPIESGPSWIMTLSPYPYLWRKPSSWIMITPFTKIRRAILGELWRSNRENDLLYLKTCLLQTKFVNLGKQLCNLTIYLYYTTFCWPFKKCWSSIRLPSNFAKGSGHLGKKTNKKHPQQMGPYQL